MGINLGGGNIGVTEKFLYEAEIAAGFQHMASEGMAQHVRVNGIVHTLLDTELLHAHLYGAMADALAALRGE